MGQDKRRTGTNVGQDKRKTRTNVRQDIHKAKRGTFFKVEYNNEVQIHNRIYTHYRGMDGVVSWAGKDWMVDK